MPLAVDGLLYRSLRRLEVDIPDVEHLPTLVDPDTVGEMGVA